MKQAKYEEIRDGIKCGDRFEFAGDSILGRLIRWFDKQPVNHTALALSIDEYSNYAGNRKFLLEAESDGIVLNTASHDILKYGGRVYWTPLLPSFDECRAAIVDWALQQVGTGYDFGNLFKNAIAHVSADMRKMFCSEFYFIALVSGGCLPQYHLSPAGCVIDGMLKPVPAPRPGEFGQFPIFGETVEILK